MSTKNFYTGFVGLLCLGCILLTTTYVTNLAFVYNEQRIGQLGLLLVGGFMVLAIPAGTLKEGAAGLPRYAVWGGALFLLLGGLSAVFSAFPFYGAVELGLFVLLGAAAAAVAVSVKKQKGAVWVVFAGASLLVLFYSLKFGLGYSFHLAGFKDFPLWPGWGGKTAVFGFSHIRFFNQVQIFTLPLVIGGALWGLKKNRPAGCFLLFLCSVWWMLLIQSAGRGVFLSALIAAILILLLFKKQTHLWIWYFIGTLAAGFLLKLFLFDILAAQEVASSTLRGGSSGRLTVWTNTFLATLERPVLGHGPMGFASFSNEFRWGHPHNSVLQFLYEFGYPATLLTLAGIWYGIKKWISQTKDLFKQFETTGKADSVNHSILIRVSLTAALFGGLIYSLFSGVIVMPLSQLWLVLVTGTVIGYYYSYNGTDSAPFSGFGGIYIFKVVILLATACIITVMVRDIPDLEENNQQYTRQVSYQTFYPRFWKQGKIGIEYEKLIDEENASGR